MKFRYGQIVEIRDCTAQNELNHIYLWGKIGYISKYNPINGYYHVHVPEYPHITWFFVEDALRAIEIEDDEKLNEGWF